MRTSEATLAEAAKQTIEMPGIAPGIGEEEFAPDAEGGEEDGSEAQSEGEGEADAGDTGSESEDGEPEGDSGEPSPEGAEDSGDDDSGAADEGAPADESTGVASRLAAIAEAEQDVRTMNSRLKKREAELNQYAQQIQEAQKSGQDLTAALKQDPFGTLEKAGVPFDSLLEAVHNAGGEIPGAKPQAKADEPPAWAKQLMDKVSAIEGMTQTQKQEENEQAYKQVIANGLKSDKYAVLGTMRNAVDTIYDIAAAHAAQTGEILPVEVIADNLQDEWEAQLNELGDHEATRKLLNMGAPPNKKQKAAGRESEETDDIQTSLSGDMPPSKGPKKKRPKTRSDAIDLAAKALGGADPWGQFQEDEDD